MFTITDGAKEELEAFFAGKAKSPVRIYMAAGGCSGPRLALALDQAGADDEVLEDQGFTFCIEKKLLAQAGGIRIDAGYMGFIVESEKPLATACASGCSGCGGGCGN